jgi:hypothetical protein
MVLSMFDKFGCGYGRARYYLYLDESGDLGHFTDSPGASRYFVITVLEVTNDKDKKTIEKAVERTLKNKLHKRRSRQMSSITELKATSTMFAIKQYFYRQVEAVPFHLYAVILDKTRFGNHLQFNHNRIYRFITHLVIKALPLETASTRVTFVLDKRMGGTAMREFNELLRLQIEAQIPPQVPLFIDHHNSNQTKPLQAVDLFSWGFFRKYEENDTKWYDVFREKVKYERVYPEK